MTRRERRELKIEPLRAVSNRKIERNKLKRKIGSNRISGAWHRHQLEKYGEDKFIESQIKEAVK